MAKGLFDIMASAQLTALLGLQTINLFMAHFYDIKRFWITNCFSIIDCSRISGLGAIVFVFGNAIVNLCQLTTNSTIAIDCGDCMLRFEIGHSYFIIIGVQFVFCALRFSVFLHHCCCRRRLLPAILKPLSHASLKRFPFIAEVLRFSRNKTFIASFSLPQCCSGRQRRCLLI